MALSVSDGQRGSLRITAAFYERGERAIVSVVGIQGIHQFHQPYRQSVQSNSPGHNFAASAVSRRQQFLIRSLEGVQGSAPSRRMAGGMTNVNSLGLEADAGSILKRITPPLDPGLHKGQAGKIAVIGGCREYTGAPYFSAISALKIGADLSHVFCTKDAAPVIKSYSPELIVHPVLEESYSIREDEKASVSSLVVAEVRKWMERFDCLVVGPGLGRDPFLMDCISEIMRHARQSGIPIVVDGDGLFLVTNNLDLIAGYSLAVLTPNVNEYKRLVEKVLGRNADDQDAAEQLLSLSRSVGGATILRKGKSDLISDGETVSMVSSFGSPRRCGGQGDILSGRLAHSYWFSFLFMKACKNNIFVFYCKKAFPLGRSSTPSILTRMIQFIDFDCATSLTRL